MPAIKFGTDGWRDIIGDNYTFANVALVAQAYAEYLKQNGAKKIVVGYDTRFMAAKFARRAAEVLAANGLEVLLAKSYTPTPALSFAALHLGADGGVMITASHNPAEYLGFKIKGPYGGGATPALYTAVEQLLGKAPEVFDPVHHHIESFDIRKPYYDHLMGLLDMEALRGYEGVLYHDSMGGAGGGWLSGFIKHAKMDRLEVREIHGVPNPTFYGVNPEPIPANQFTVMAVLKAEEGQTFSAITDGDADRIGAVLAGGANFNCHQIFAVLLKHLVAKGQSGKVIKTFSVSKIIELLCSRYGLELSTTPIGFKYITDGFLAGGVLMGGEESGGIGIGDHLPERDGLYNALLLLESVIHSGKSLGQQFAEIEAEVGFKHAYDRLDLHLPSMAHIATAMEKAKHPTTIAGQAVTATESLDGIKWHLGDTGWLLFRASGTEPVLRIYCEAQDDKAVQAILAQAKKLAGL